MNLAEIYFLKAVDHYPYHMEVAIENLNYSISYDDSYAPSLCLMGRVYMYFMKDYDNAEEYFNLALAADFDYTDAHIYMLTFYLLVEKFDSFDKLIKHSFKITGINRLQLYRMKGQALEASGKLEKAVKAYKQAKNLSFTKDSKNCIEDELKRVEGKIKKLNKVKDDKYVLRNPWVKTFSI